MELAVSQKLMKSIDVDSMIWKARRHTFP
jgi:hypothetical protein